MKKKKILICGAGGFIGGQLVNNLLKETNLKMDIHGRTRNAKSFRSTFIMYRLMDRQPIKAVAQNCGTSSSVIDAYYARYITMDMFGDSFTDLPK
mgnify:CR=1 FL=1